MGYDVSIFCSGNRPGLWRRLYESYAANNAKFEIVIAGDKRPIEKLPSNFKYIYTPVKPAQCGEIALQSCSGEFVSMTGDDCVASPGYLDTLVSEYNKYNDEKMMLCGKILYNKDEMPDTRASEIKGSPIISYIGLGSRIRFQNLGVDRLFLGSYWDLDIMMRHLEANGKITKCDSVFLNEWHPHKEKMGRRERDLYRKERRYREERNKRLRLSRRTRRDYGLYESLWIAPLKLFKGEAHCSDGKRVLSKHRLRPFKPFGKMSDGHILYHNQGKQSNIWNG
jgi:hypothetical protein